MTMGEVPFTPRAKQILEIAANEAKEMKSQFVRTSHLLLALLKDKDGVAAQILAAFGVDHKTAKEEVIAVLQGKPSGSKREKKKSKTPFLDHFGRDLTDLACQGKLDPTIGRDEEIQRVSQVLSRRKKNNRERRSQRYSRPTGPGGVHFSRSLDVSDPVETCAYPTWSHLS